MIDIEWLVRGAHASSLKQPVVLPSAQVAPQATTPTPSRDPVTTSPQRRMRRRQAAAYLGVSPGFLEKHACRGTGPPYLRISSRLVLYERDELDRWAAARRVRSTSDAGADHTD
jgi:hypothetical protein